MIYIVTRENRRMFHTALTQMHQQRKALFIDQMGWRLDPCGDLEIDCFDTEDALYLIEIGDDGQVLQSARLISSERPHLLSDVFAELCSAGAPRDTATFEASRFCPAPATPKGAARQRLLFRMIGAIMETSLLFGIERVTFVASAALAPLALAAGWEVERLGPNVRWGRERLCAMAAAITPEGLARVRARHVSAFPLTRYLDAKAKRAA